MFAVMFTPFQIVLSPALWVASVVVFGLLPLALLVYDYRDSMRVRHLVGGLLVALAFASMAASVDAAILYWDCKWSWWC